MTPIPRLFAFDLLVGGEMSRDVAEGKYRWAGVQSRAFAALIIIVYHKTYPCQDQENPDRVPPVPHDIDDVVFLHVPVCWLGKRGQPCNNQWRQAATFETLGDSARLRH